jgi:enoyl-CoA hydratase/carnithine racemase
MAGLDQAGARRFITAVHEACRSIRRLPVPVIARIDGYALGAGLEIAASADFRVASTRSQFGMPEVKVGIPSVVEAALLPQLIGWGRARELLLFGETIDARTALAWGLIERAVDAGSLDVTVESCVGLLMKAGPRAIRLQKRLIADWEELPPSKAIEAGIAAFAEAFASDEPRLRLGQFAQRKRR